MTAQHNALRNKDYFLALLYEYLIFTRHTAGPERMAIASKLGYALHNLPSILKIEPWDTRTAESAWREVRNRARLAGCLDWILEMDEILLDRAASSDSLLPKWHIYD